MCLENEGSGGGEARVGERLFEADDLACTAIRPRPGSRRASVAFVGGTGIKGMRALDDLPILYARIFRPDFALRHAIRALASRPAPALPARYAGHEVTRALFVLEVAPGSARRGDGFVIVTAEDMLSE